MQEKLILNRKEQNRLKVLNQIEGKKLTVDSAAILFELTPRHIWRLLAAYRKEGASALAHGNRGRKPCNGTEDMIRQQVVKSISFRQTHSSIGEDLAQLTYLMLIHKLRAKISILSFHGGEHGKETKSCKV
jgi:hypothetical protein